ncbi:hypothetical protein S1OALGB6SA_2258 [Olavius algarvensis spirochete endosymbiont]|nr:hypothetical protein S1OALGB6SA_2258 [Olavius algarvensis spirochete endosymbiont]
MGRGDGCRYNAVYAVRMRAADKWGKGYSNQRHQLGIRGLKVIATYNKGGEISTPTAGSFRAVLIPHRTMRLLEHVRGERVKACYFAQHLADPMPAIRFQLPRALRRQKAGFTPHVLRHAYNIRMREILQEEGVYGTETRCPPRADGIRIISYGIYRAQELRDDGALRPPRSGSSTGILLRAFSAIYRTNLGEVTYCRWDMPTIGPVC